MVTDSTSIPSEPVARTLLRTEASFYHPELDALRFFAFFLVFLHHGLSHDSGFYTKLHVPQTLASIFAGIGATGAFGVDLFFALSSYLITELLLRERNNLGKIDVRGFYARRILRIWPLYFTFLALAAAMQWFVPGQHIGWQAGLAFLSLAGNWWIVFVGFPSSVIFPLWSISIEEQFYVVWPAIAKRVTERGMLVVAGAMLFVATTARFYLGVHHTWESKVWCNTFVQLDPIALGIILAVLLGGAAPALRLTTRLSLAIGGITCFALAGNYWVIKGDPLATSSMVIGYPVVALGSISLLLAVLSPAATLRKNPLVYLGRISYGLYVFHVLGLMISDYTVQNQTTSFSRYLLRLVVALIATILMAAVSYRWLETPFLKLKQRFTHILSRPGG